MRLSYRNSAGRREFAKIPPTRAADKKTISGRFSRKKRSTAALFLRSSSAWVRSNKLLQPSWLSLRRIAEPTNPRCPATNTFVASESRNPSGMCSPTRNDFMSRVLQGLLLACQFQVSFDHRAHQIFEADLWLPPKQPAGLS